MDLIIKPISLQDLSQDTVNNLNSSYGYNLVYFDLPDLDIDQLSIKIKDNIPEDLKPFIHSMKGLDLKQIKHEIGKTYHPDMGGDIESFKLLMQLLL